MRRKSNRRGRRPFPEDRERVPTSSLCKYRSLTEAEKRYSQIEREALAAEFTTNRLHMYLLGADHFELATDHKPLLPIFNNPRAKLPPTIERMVMKMQNLDFTAVYIPGKTNATITFPDIHYLR